VWHVVCCIRRLWEWPPVRPQWIMHWQSCWALYTSFAMPPKGTDPLLEEANLEVTVEEQIAEVRRYNHSAYVVH
jgi:hypothetical protein